jgi:glycosyltransferase involved in cell wall biosynthesis
MCSKPIIVNDDTSMADIVRNEKCGIVVPYGDVEAIKKAISQLIQDRQLSNLLGENGRKAYETRYSWNIMETRLIHAYESLSEKSDYE